MTQKIICGRCGGAGSRRGDKCNACDGAGERTLDAAMLAELRSRVTCVSGAEVEGLLDLIDAQRLVVTASTHKLAHDKSEHYGNRCQGCFDVDDAMETALKGVR